MYCHELNGKYIIQEAEYIEHGWYIVVTDVFELYEIPMGGGEPIRIGFYTTLKSAIEAANLLT